MLLKTFRSNLIFSFIWGIILLTWCGATPINNGQPIHDQLERRIATLLKQPRYANMHVGIDIRSLHKNATPNKIVNYQEDALFIPASLVKLILS